MDYSKYNENWRDVIRPQILKRDDYKCRVCGIRHKQDVYKDSRGNYVELDSFQKMWAQANNKKIFKVYLQVAHVDQNKENNDPLNLLSLCPKDHAKLDAKFKGFARIQYRRKIEQTPKQNISLIPEQKKELIQDLKRIINEVTLMKITISDAKLIYLRFIDLLEKNN